MREIGVIPEWTSRRRFPDDRPGAKLFRLALSTLESLRDERVDFAGSIELSSEEPSLSVVIDSPWDLKSPFSISRGEPYSLNTREPEWTAFERQADEKKPKSATEHRLGTERERRASTS